MLHTHRKIQLRVSPWLQSWNKQQENNNTPTGLSWDTSPSNWPFFFLFLNLIQWYPLTKNSCKTKISSHQMILAWYTIKYTGVTLIANFCVNIAFSGAIHILATLPRHHTQNDWTLVQQVTAHWWLPCHSILDQFTNSMWSQPWLRPSTSPVNEGRNLDDVINVQAAIILVCMATPLPPPPPPQKK